MSDETPKTYSLHLSGEGINIKQEVDQSVALRVVQVVMGAGVPVARASSAGSKGEMQSADRVPLSLREYLDKIGPSKKRDQITTIAHYICDYEGQDDFSRDDIRSRFLTAREPPPGNFGRDFAAALKSGWIAEVHGKKNRFYVTAKGAHAIESNFSNGKGAAGRR